MKNVNINKILQIIIIILLLWIFLFPRSKKSTKNDNNIIKIDSILKAYKTDTIKGTFKSEKPIPITVKNYYNLPKNSTKNDYLTALITELKNKYDKKIDSLDILKELLEAKKIREYIEIKEDSFIIAEIKSTTKGTLENQIFTYTLKPQTINTYEKTIKTKNKPLFSAFLGGGIQSTAKDLKGTSFGVNLSVQNKKGNIIEIGYNTNKQFNFGYKKILFSKYK